LRFYFLKKQNWKVKKSTSGERIGNRRRLDALIRTCDSPIGRRPIFIFLQQQQQQLVMQRQPWIIDSLFSDPIDSLPLRGSLHPAGFR
jgi:hypothetical protein